MTTNLQLGIKLGVEWGVEVKRPGTVRKLLHRPVLQGWLLIVEEDSAILDCRRSMGATRRGDKEIGMLRSRNISPPFKRLVTG